MPVRVSGDGGARDQQAPGAVIMPVVPSVDVACGACGGTRLGKVPTEVRQVGALGEEGQSHPGRVLRVGNVALDLESRELNVNGVVSVLTPKQCKLLGVFMTSPGEVLTRKHLIKQVWETDYVGDTRTLDVHVRWLREKIEEDPARPTRIVTVRGAGYRFEG
mgnify:CR=1 FL=1